MGSFRGNGGTGDEEHKGEKEANIRTRRHKRYGTVGDCNVDANCSLTRWLQNAIPVQLASVATLYRLARGVGVIRQNGHDATLNAHTIKSFNEFGHYVKTREANFSAVIAIRQTNN